MGVVHTGRHYTNFVWSMNFTVCLFVSLPLQVWLFHLPFFSPVFWVLDTYKVLYSQFLTQALLDFITEILCQTKRRLCLPLFASYEWLTPSTQCNFFFSSSNPSAFEWFKFGLPVSRDHVQDYLLKARYLLILVLLLTRDRLLKTNSEMRFWAILKLGKN